MEMQKRIMAREEDRLSDLPDSIQIHILSLLPDSKEVVRTSVLSTRWRFLWMSVPVSLEFDCCSISSEKVLDFIASVNRELYYWRSCSKIRNFKLFGLGYSKSYVKDVDLWVHFATKVANVDHFMLYIDYNCDPEEYYELPQFAFKNTLLKDLVLSHCLMNPSGIVTWNSLVSLSIACAKFTEGVLEKVLSGCPNLESLVLDEICGIRRLEISSAKLRELTITDCVSHREGLEILAPYIQTLKLTGSCFGIHFPQRNVPSLVTAVLYFHCLDFPEDEVNYDDEYSYFKELLHTVAHVQNLKLGPWCIECLFLLELEGCQSPPSSRKFLKLNSALERLDFLGMCNFLQSSSDLETLVIDWSSYGHRYLLSMYTNEDEQSRRFERHNLSSSLQHLKTIKIINFHGSSGNLFILSLVEYFLKNATVLEELVIVAKSKGSDVSQDYVKMEQEILTFPRSSPHSSVVFSY